MNYSHANNCYSYVKLILKKMEYQNIITEHAQSIHVRIEFTRWNTFNVLRRNEFDCALKPKAYTKMVQVSMKSITIKLLAVQLEENYFHQFQERLLPGLGLSVL